MKHNKNMKDMILPMMLMNGGSFGNFGSLDMSNPLMLMAFMGGSEGKDFFPMLMLNQMMTSTLTSEKKEKKENITQE